MTQIAYWPDLPYPDDGYGDDYYVDDEGNAWLDAAVADAYYDFGPAPGFEPAGGFRPDAISLVAIALVLLVAFWLLAGRSGLFESGGNRPGAETTSAAAGSQAVPQTQSPPIDTSASQAQNGQPVSAIPTADTIIAPYDDYLLTQGPHGVAYGHLAIDISAGKGAEIKSPIQGTVTNFYYDEVGNTTLVIENERYQVMLLHGLYTVEVGQSVALGQVVGTESNQGNTLDMAGNSCRGRDCGYHTHLNIFDKTYGVNVNPLELLP